MTPILTYYHLSDCVTAFSTTRHGGFSQGNYAELNLNDYCGDDPELIERNREILRKQLKINTPLVIPHQIHGTEVRSIDANFLQLSAVERQSLLEGVDAVMTNVEGLCIGVSTADCIPLLVYDPMHHVVAAIHAGWRGTVARIAENTITAMAAVYGSWPKDLQVVIGPGISLSHFEVGQEVYDAFAEAAFPMEQIARRFEKWHINLPLCNKLQLESMGVVLSNIQDTAICTYEQFDDYFSARRLGIHSGRIYTGIMLDNK